METIEIELSRIFVKVVQQGSFTRAGEILNVPKSTVSKAVTRLEKITGTKLLLRTTRSQTLTDAGRTFYETCLGPIQTLEDAQKSLFGQDSLVTGHIKVTAPEDLGTYLIAPAIGELCKKFPELSFDLQYSNKIIDLVKDGFDLAIRIGHLKESQLKAKKIGRLELILVASDEYISTHNKIKSVRDLKDHDCLSISGLSMSRNWELSNGARKNSVLINPKILCNQMSSLLQAAKAGAGVLLAPAFMCQPEINKGSLKRVLNGWSNQGLPVSIVSPVSISGTARLKIVGDQIFSAIRHKI